MNYACTGVQTGTYRPVDNIYRQRDRGANDALSGRRCEPYSFVDKLFRKIEAIRIDKLADAIVNPPALSSQGIRKTNSTAVPVVSRFTFPSQDIFGISGYLCQTCFTINPAVFLYSSTFNMQDRSSIVNFVDPCPNCTSQMTSEEKNHYLCYNLSNGIAPLLFNWIRVFWPEDQKMKLIAIRVSELGRVSGWLPRHAKPENQ